MAPSKKALGNILNNEGSTPGLWLARQGHVSYTRLKAMMKKAMVKGILQLECLTRHPPGGHLKTLSCPNLRKLKKRLDNSLRTKGEILHSLRKSKKKNNHQRQRILGKQEFTR
ncbi:hypothetical protein M9H77_14848 [Catharanthus roseus]|uniref:Uncharacterized protein n=1 Tax=Catharanthus roseus TaxID=4058 RepID=A0ACC0BPH5_CATRO|nr:hypothetical protein M9H77_14848 [Catharanthus roseus]